MAWINQKLEPDRIDPEDEELQGLNGGKPLSDKVLEAAKAGIREELAKMKLRYAAYVEKYVLTRVTPVDMEEVPAEEPPPADEEEVA